MNRPSRDLGRITVKLDEPKIQCIDSPQRFFPHPVPLVRHALLRVRAAQYHPRSQSMVLSKSGGGDL
jgi:hypothetical protein